jgi:hypothetical protein
VDRNVPAVQATFDAFLHPLLNGALWIGSIALAVAALAAITGPYAWAVSLRRRVVDAGREVAAAAGARSRDEATTAWVASHVDALRIGGVAAGLALLWLLDLSWLGIGLLAALVGAYELGLSRVADQPSALP